MNSDYKSWIISKKYSGQRNVISLEEFYTQPTPKECQAMNDELNELVVKIQNDLINTYGRLPNLDDITFNTIIEGDKTYLIVEKKKPEV